MWSVIFNICIIPFQFCVCKFITQRFKKITPFETNQNHIKSHVCQDEYVLFWSWKWSVELNDQLDLRVERDVFKTEEKHPLNIYFKNQANNYNSAITSWVLSLCQSVGELVCPYCPYVPELYWIDESTWWVLLFMTKLKPKEIYRQHFSFWDGSSSDV